MLDAAHADADRALLTARVQAESTLERSRLQIAELEAAGLARSNEFNRLVDELRSAAAGSASELRSAGSRLAEMADHFEFELATRGEGIGGGDHGSVGLLEERVEVT